jgi:hypothetical protein
MSRPGSTGARTAPNGGMAFLPIVAFLVTAWLLSRLVDRCYRRGAGPDETLMQDEPQPAPIGSIMGA